MKAAPFIPSLLLVLATVSSASCSIIHGRNERLFAKSTLPSRQKRSPNNTGGGQSSSKNNTGGGQSASQTNTGGGQSSSQNNSGGAQSSLTLDPKVIATGFENNGQDVPVAGQVASLTSSNNFINFCLTFPNLPITNGKQISTGSCNPAPMGAIPSVDNMPSSKFTNPKNGDTIPANQAFTISMTTNNLVTGNFVNAATNYYAAPQQLDKSGLIIGHSHVVVEALDAPDQTTPTNPNNFAFFKGLNKGGSVLTTDVTAGLPAGAYRMCSINAAANHQPVLAPIAQHGSMDDCVYFTAANGNGNGGANSNGNGNGNTGNANGGNASSSSAATATPSANTNGTGGANHGGGKGQGGGGR